MIVLTEIVYPKYPTVDIVPSYNNRNKLDGHQLKINGVLQPFGYGSDSMEYLENKKKQVFSVHMDSVVFLYLNEELILDVMNKFKVSQDVAVLAIQHNFYNYGRSIKDAKASNNSGASALTFIP